MRHNRIAYPLATLSHAVTRSNTAHLHSCDRMSDVRYWPLATFYSILATIFIMSAAEKARIDSVRILPNALRLKLSAVADSSSGASMTDTMSYRPCVQNISFTVTSNVLAICLKASARFGESLAFLTPWSVNVARTI